MLVKPYNATGDNDPDLDDGATKNTRSTNGATLVTIDTSTTGSKTGDLTATADDHILGNLSSPGFYSLAFTQTLFDLGEVIDIEALENAGTDPATLTVTWTPAASARMLASLGVGT